MQLSARLPTDRRYSTLSNNGGSLYSLACLLSPNQCSAVALGRSVSSGEHHHRQRTSNRAEFYRLTVTAVSLRVCW